MRPLWKKLLAGLSLLLLLSTDPHFTPVMRAGQTEPAATKVAAGSSAITPAYKTITFAILGKFKIPDKQLIIDRYNRRTGKPPKIEFKIPDDILALNGEKVEVSGYMYPMEEPDGDRIGKFVVARNPVSCCFGCSNGLNDYITAAMPDGKKTKLMMDTPVLMRGILHVGAHYENGFLVSIYQMSVESMVSLEK